MREDEETVRDLIAFVEEQVNRLRGLSLEQIPLDLFDGFTNELQTAISVLTNARMAFVDSRRVVSEALARSQEMLAEVGTALDDINALYESEDALEIDEIDEIHLPELPPMEDNTFDPHNNTYLSSARETIERLGALWEVGARREFLDSVATWQTTASGMRQVLANRVDASPSEIGAFERSIDEVYTFLYKSGCGGSGCLVSGQMWFVDSGVSRAYWETFAQGLDAYSKLLESLGQNQNLAAYHAAIREMATWKAPLSKNQQMIVQVFLENLKTMSALESYWRLRRDIDNAAFREAQIALLEMQESIHNATMFVGRAAADFAGGLGNAIDFCEVTTGLENCLPNGKTLTVPARILSIVGVLPFVTGSGVRAAVDALAANNATLRRILDTTAELETAVGKAAMDNTRAAAKRLASTGMQISEHAATFVLDLIRAAPVILKTDASRPMKHFLADDLVRITTRYGKLESRMATVVGKPMKIKAWRAIKTQYIQPGDDAAEAVFRTTHFGTDANHRFSMPSRNAIYTSIGEENLVKRTIVAEFRGIESDMLTFASKEFDLKNVLDLTDPIVLEALQLDLNNEVIKKGFYEVTHQIGDLAKKLGFDGILCASAQLRAGTNLIVFP